MDLFNTILDTSAQLTNGTPKQANLKDFKKVFLKRSRSKWYTQKIAGKLIFLDSPLKKQYQRAYYCSQDLTQQNNTIYSKYCNSRICNVCNRIRTAKLFNGYIVQIGELKNLKFGTLTAPNVTGDQLRFEITRYIKDFRFIINKRLAHMFGRKGGVKWNGIRKIEVTYNAKNNTYHPHIHFLGSDYSDLIIKEWLSLRPDATRAAQDIREANENSLNELFKYTTKILIKAEKQNTINIHLSAIDNIMIALTNKRTFQPYGIIKKVSEDVDELSKKSYLNLPEYNLMGWKWYKFDWVNEHGEMFSGYNAPDIEFIYID